MKIGKPIEEENPASYYNCKLIYAHYVKAIVDSRYRFLTYWCCCIASPQDSLILQGSCYGRYLKEGCLGKKFWIAADEAYIRTDSVKIDVSSFQVSEPGDDVNLYHSSLRMYVEQALGILEAKWETLMRQLGFSIRNSEIISLNSSDGTANCTKQYKQLRRKQFEE